jgi:hypothetical protein
MEWETGRQPMSLNEKYPPSEPCDCEICKAFCIRPGWWTVEEAARAMEAGYGNRMMMEIAPEFTFGVLSPAFKGCEGDFALQEYSRSGCNFLHDDLCELHGTGLQPIECRFCHHSRSRQGLICHYDIAKDWRTLEGQELVKKWASVYGLYAKYKIRI